MRLYRAIQQFSNKNYVRDWFAKIKWPRGCIKCPDCNGREVEPYNHPSMPYRCTNCWKPISLKVGTIMQRSSIPLHKWTATVAYDLVNPTGITISSLRQKIKISRNSARSLLNQVRALMVNNSLSEEFSTGTYFRLNLIHYDVRPTKIHNRTIKLNSQPNSTKVVVVCITASNSDKIRVKTVPKEKLATISELITKILPDRAAIFTDQTLMDKGLIPKKYTVRKEEEFDEYEKAKLKAVGQFTNEVVKGAAVELEGGFKSMYHKMTFEQLDLYVQVFAGRWNIRHLPFEEQMKIIFSKMVIK